MDTPQTSQWFVRKGEDVLGPFQLEELKQGACQGWVDGADAVSGSLEGPWIRAGELEGLEMEWEVRNAEGQPLPCCHVLALRERVESGKFQPYWEVKHLPSGEMYDVVDALCSALLAQNRLLERQLAGERSAPDQVDASTDSESGDAPQLRLRLDEARREAEKFRRLYAEEQDRGRQRRAELEAQTQELRAWQSTAAERIKALERRARAGELSAGATLESELRGAYDELKLQQDHLIASLQLQARHLEEARAQQLALEAELREERARNQEATTGRDTLREDTLSQLRRLEQAHLQLVRAYRELNDRAIRLRTTLEEGQPPAPAPKAPPARPTPAPPSSSPPPTVHKLRPGGNAVKLRMT